MSDGIYTRHATLNAGAIPASAEELSQRHLKLFQQYSRLKAQHAVLKKAVIQEQASNITLQGNVKEKEKELRKLQEQIDLLSFHNERLTKRIQAVQESEQKGSHFSILGGSARKELEKSAQALEEANLDLERKIEENEKLHEELTETQSEFTHNINSLLRQIQTFEAKIAEIQDENTALLSEVNQLQSKKEENTLHEEIDRLKEELKEKTRFLEERGNSNELTAEVESLRAIVLAKLGNIEKDELKSTSLNEVLPATKALDELKEQARAYIHALTDNKSLHGLPEEIAIKLNLSHETWSEELRQLYSQLDKTKAALDKLVAEKTAIEKELLEDKKMSEESLNELKKDMAVQKENQEQSIQEKEAKVNELMSHIQLLENQSREGADEVNRIKQLETNIEDMSKENKALDKEKNELTKANEDLNKTNKELLEAKLDLEKIHENCIKEKERLESINKTLGTENANLKDELVKEKKNSDHIKVDYDNKWEKLNKEKMNLSQENAFLETDNESLQQEINSLTEQNKQNVLEKSRLEESIKELKETISQQQVMASKKTIDVESETSPKEKEEEEEEDEVFVYPADKEEEEDEEEEDEEEEEVFVYRGRDAVITEEEPIQQQEKLVDDVRTVPVDNSESIEKQIQARENKLKEYYEHQIGQLREKIQMTDSKVVRYADLYGAYKEKLMSAEQTKLGLFDEISRLTKEIGHAEDALTTTEVNYQKQVDAMTEYITRLQEELEAYKRRNYNQR